MLEEVRKPIDAEMRHLERLRCRLLTSDNPLLNAALHHIAERQGKMLRPMLSFLVSKALGTKSTATRLRYHSEEGVMHAAMSLELLHTASLLHDDVVDESDQRRGQRSVNALMGNQVAVLVGDYVLSTALSESALTRSPNFIEAVARLGQDLADGELLQLSTQAGDDLSETPYYDIIKRKTGSLFATACEAPARLSTRPAKGKNLAQWGMLLGLIFQMQDDIMDLTAPQHLGKPAGNDMREGKLTLPVLHAVQNDESLRPAALRVRRLEANEEDIQLLTQAATDIGVSYAQQEMQTYANILHNSVSDFAQGEIAEALNTLVEYVMQRNK